ncbi:MAG: hypothetical protein ABI538_13420 [Pseudoxanthomonas sp.]
MARSRPRSRGIRNPVRNALLLGLFTAAGIALIAVGVVDMRASEGTGSPLMLPGLFLALLCPIACVHYLRTIAVVGGMRSGRDAIARWTVPANEFNRFREGEARIPKRSVMVNFYKPPHYIPEGGVEVVFSNRGVLIGDGYFPLSSRRGRRIESVRHVDSNPPSIEFSLAMTSPVRTSSVTVDNVRATHALRVPVAADATRQASEVVRCYQAILHGRKA